MSALRKILMPLLIIPLGMLTYVVLYPDRQLENTGLEFLFLLVGVPIVIVNFTAWFHPEIIQAYFPVKEDWGQKRRVPVTFAIVLSALVAFTCVGVGAASAVASFSSQATFKPSGVLSATAAAFARSVRSLSSATASGENFIVSTPRPSLEADILPEPTPQIPVSGGVPTSSPTLSTDSSALSVSVTQTEVPATSPTPIGSPSTPPTGMASSQRSCTPASADYTDAIVQTVQDADAENVVTAAWMVSSNAAANLWFIAANVQSGTGTTTIGVWGLFDYSEGNLDVYAINESATELSYAASGEDSEPVLTMQSDGAQAAYDCAARAQ